MSVTEHKEYSEGAYEALIAGLFSRVQSFGAVGAAAYKPGLERMTKMCSIMGDPQKCCRIIHVAGTNGKGSTCNMLAACLAAQGLKVGLYTSPHILDFRERMRVVSLPGGVDGRSCVTLIPRRAVWDFMQRYGAAVEELELSFFEITTSMALCWFADSGVDAAVIETGLGGRLDATNVVTPVLSVITNIGYDHMDLLGNTLAEIAGEKGGIIKAGVPVVIGERGEESDPVFTAIAAERGAPITFAEDASGDAGPADARVPQPAAGALPADADLQGIYQLRNRRTVMAALRMLGMEPDSAAIFSAARICDFHGRWERILDNPVTIADIGHNAHGLRYNFSQLDAMLDGGDFSDLVMVYGSVADKDVDAVLKLLPARAYIYFTAADNHRAMPAGELFRRAFVLRGPELEGEVADDVPDAVGRALERCSSLRRPLLYIGGSTYVVSEAVKTLKK